MKNIFFLFEKMSFHCLGFWTLRTFLVRHFLLLLQILLHVGSTCSVSCVLRSSNSSRALSLFTWKCVHSQYIIFCYVEYFQNYDFLFCLSAAVTVPIFPGLLINFQFTADSDHECNISFHISLLFSYTALLKFYRV